MAIKNLLMQSSYLQKLIYLPWWKIHSLLFVFIVLAALATDYFVLSSERQKQRQLNQDRVNVNQQLSKIAAIYDSQPNQHDILTNIDTIKQQLSIYSDLSDVQHLFTDILDDYLQQSGCQLLNLSNQPTKEIDKLTLYTWQLQLGGNYRQLLAFISLLNQHTQLFVFESLEIKPENVGLRLSLTITLYRLNN